MGTGPAHQFLLCLASLAVTACGGSESEPDPEPGVTAFVGARILDGTSAAYVDDGVLLVQGGRLVEIGSRQAVPVPEDATVVELFGGTVIPGLINAHGHVGDVRGLETGHYTEENLLRQLRLYAHYGVTTVASLGGDEGAGIALRDAQDTPNLTRARLLVAGPVIQPETPDEAWTMVDEVADMQTDFVKIRVDDNLGSTSKMPPAVYHAVIERSLERGMPVASHVFYLEDAKGLLRAGTGLVAHSVRDRDVDEEFLALLSERGVCYCPTLVREVSTFVYEERPGFFDDPFFLERADADVLEELTDPERQERIRSSSSAQAYKRALEVAKRNLSAVSNAGIPIAFGTDTGPPGRFQGYFEHLEMELMAEAGLSPWDILRSATADAATCLGREDIGTLERGKWADFIVLNDDPLADVRNMREIRSVWIAGNRVR